MLGVGGRERCWTVVSTLWQLGERKGLFRIASGDRSGSAVACSDATAPPSVGQLREVSQRAVSICNPPRSSRDVAPDSIASLPRPQHRGYKRMNSQYRPKGKEGGPVAHAGRGAIQGGADTEYASHPSKPKLHRTRGARRGWGRRPFPLSLPQRDLSRAARGGTSPVVADKHSVKEGES